MNRNGQRRGSGMNWFQRQMKMRPKPLWMVIILHVLVLGAALLIYALPHHVISREEQAVGISSKRNSGATTAQSTQDPSVDPTASPSPTQGLDLGSAALGIAPNATPEPTAVPTPTPAPTDAVGQFRIKFADKFTSGEVEMTENTYKSAYVNVSFSKVRYGNADVNVADIYVADIANFITVFGKDTYGRGSKYTENVVDYARRMNGIATLSGDYYGARDNGVVIRNGTLYRDDKVTRDVAVLYWDGTMKTFSPSEFDAEREIIQGAYHCWNFGPELLDENGMPMESFNSDVTGRNPRAIIGYYEPGHYAFIMVDGRSENSSGLSMKDCSKMCYEAGLKAAFNLDGGRTAVMAKAGEVFGDPYKDGRKVSDVLMIVDGDQGGAR